MKRTQKTISTAIIEIHKMTVLEYGEKGKHLNLSYSVGESPFGRYLVASTEKGITNLFFFEGKEKEAINNLKRMWPLATLNNKLQKSHKQISHFFKKKIMNDVPIPLHIKGTDFEYAVWKALLAVPEGKTLCYKDISKILGKPQANRAVGTAVGKNAVGYVIPCHRIVPSTGGIGNYRWGSARKKAMLEYEKAPLLLQ